MSVLRAPLRRRTDRLLPDMPAPGRGKPRPNMCGLPERCEPDRCRGREGRGPFTPARLASLHALVEGKLFIGTFEEFAQYVSDWAAFLETCGGYEAD